MFEGDSIRLDNKVVIVTAGAGGIGSEIVRIASRRGAKTVIANYELEAGESLAHDIVQGGGDAIALPYDLLDENSIKNTIKQTISHYGRIDVIANNAALIVAELAQKDQNIENMSTELWDKTFAANTRGTMIACREALPNLIKTKGNIVNTVSNLALQGHIIQVAYASSKAAIIQMTKSIAASHARKGVRCNAVAPGMTMTKALKDGLPASIQNMVAEETLRDQLGDPEDIAEVICWLASDSARNMTGQIVVADGGLASHVPGFGPFNAMINGEHHE